MQSNEAITFNIDNATKKKMALKTFKMFFLFESAFFSLYIVLMQGTSLLPLPEGMSFYEALPWGIVAAFVFAALMTFSIWREYRSNTTLRFSETTGLSNEKGEIFSSQVDKLLKEYKDDRHYYYASIKYTKNNPDTLKELGFCDGENALEDIIRKSAPHIEIVEKKESKIIFYIFISSLLILFAMRAYYQYLQ